MTQSIPLDEDLIAAIARLESVVGVLEGAAREVPETAEGRDDTGMIAIVVRNTGSIADLSIDYRWRDDLDPAELGSALTAAIGDARNELLQGAEDYAARHRDDADGVDADRTRERIEEVSSGMLATSLFVAPASVEELVEEALQKADALDGLAHDIEAIARDDASESLNPTSVDPIVVRRAGGQVIGVDVDPQWAKNTPTAMLVQRLVDAVVTTGDLPIAAGNDEADMTILRLLSTLHSLPGKKE